MKIRESAEDYLETILILQAKKPNVRSIDIAVELNYSKPSVSVAMKKLEDLNYITRDNSGFIKLTEKGYEIASGVYERHTLIADFFMSIGVCERTALTDACRIEHIISEESFAKLKEHLNKIKNSKE